jgi:hypothetical protein
MTFNKGDIVKDGLNKLYTIDRLLLNSVYRAIDSSGLPFYLDEGDVCIIKPSKLLKKLYDFPDKNNMWY